MAEKLPAANRKIGESAAWDGKAANLHDTNPLTNGPCRGIAFATAGAIKLVTLKGDTETIPSGVLSPGIIHPIGAQQIWSTGTTATGIWVFY